jgi:hypothetical protein
MELTDLVVLIFIVTCFAAFMATLAWASRPPRRTGNRVAPPVSSGVTRQTGSYSVSHQQTPPHPMRRCRGVKQPTHSKGIQIPDLIMCTEAAFLLSPEVAPHSHRRCPPGRQFDTFIEMRREGVALDASPESLGFRLCRPGGCGPVQILYRPDSVLELAAAWQPEDPRLQQTLAREKATATTSPELIPRDS